MKYSNWSKRYERELNRVNRARQNKDRKMNISFQGTSYEVIRLKEGTYEVFRSGGLVKNPPYQILRKAKEAFCELDVQEVMLA